MIALFRRGRHRANRFSIRVADLQAQLNRERMPRELRWRGWVWLPGGVPGRPVVLSIAPRGSVIPVLAVNS